MPLATGPPGGRWPIAHVLFNNGPVSNRSVEVGEFSL